MRIYPSITEYYHSPLTPQEVARCLQRHTSNALFEYRTKEFKGNVSANGFTLRRLNWFTNVSNRPNIAGRVQSNPTGGSEVIICQSLLLINYLVGSSISLVVAILLGAALGSGSNDLVGILLGLIVAGLVFALASASVLVPFWLEVRRSRQLLVELLQLQEAAPQ